MQNFVNDKTPTLYREAGFTLIELMISLVLGLLISAAVVQIYLTNVRTSTIQKGGSELQDASVFGLQQLENHIRLANLGNSVNKINNETVKGGIVLTGLNLGSYSTNATTGAKTDTYTTPGYLTHSKGDTNNTGTNGWTGASNTTVNGNAEASDQLTIQFLNTTGSPMADCEGNTVPAYDANTTKTMDATDYPNRLVIERFYLRPVSGSTYNATSISNLVLACDAGRIDLDANMNPVKTSPTSNIVAAHDFGANNQLNFGGSGQEFIQNVDQFKILLGVQSNNTEVRYVNSRDYLAMTGDKPSIVSVKLGMIVHGATPIVGTDDATKFSILGTENILKDKDSTTRSKQVRTTYESTTLLRNARVIAVDTDI